MAKKIKAKYEPKFLDQTVTFYDGQSGYDRMGTCYKEQNGFCWMRDKLGHRYKSNINDVKLFMSEQTHET